MFAKILPVFVLVPLKPHGQVLVSQTSYR
jgi:hypothetical protein